MNSFNTNILPILPSIKDSLRSQAFFLHYEMSTPLWKSLRGLKIEVDPYPSIVSLQPKLRRGVDAFYASFVKESQF
jgi:hypothetical protein